MHLPPVSAVQYGTIAKPVKSIFGHYLALDYQDSNGCAIPAAVFTSAAFLPPRSVPGSRSRAARRGARGGPIVAAREGAGPIDRVVVARPLREARGACAVADKSASSPKKIRRAAIFFLQSRVKEV